MAVLQKIRNKGVLLVASIAVALFLFVVGDALRGGEVLFAQSKQQAGEVNGESLSIQDYQKMVDELQVYYEIMSQKNSFSEDELNRIKDEAWQNYIQSSLIKKECDALGLSVTDDEIAEVIRMGATQLLQVPFFMNQQTGRYDYSSLQNFLSEYKKMKDASTQIPEVYEKLYKYYMFVQKSVRDQLLGSKYQTLIAKCLLSNPIEAKMAFDGRNTESDVVLAAIPFSSVDDSKISVSDEDVKAKYNEDKEKYRQSVETRDIKYIDVQIQASREDKAATESEMSEAYDKLAVASDNAAAGNVVRSNASLMAYANVLKSKDAYPAMISVQLDSMAVGQTVRPAYDAMTNTYYTFRLLDKVTEADSVLYRQLAVGGNNEQEIAAKADSIIGAINGGATLKSIAKKYNQEGDSMWISTAAYQNSNLDAENALFISTLYGMNKGETKKLSLPNGYTVILQVVDTKNPITKYNVAAVVKELKFSDETYKNEYNKFSSFVASNTTAEKLEANAEKNGYRLLSLNDVANNAHNIAGVHKTNDIVKWLFDEAEKGAVSQLYECGDNNHLMLVTLTNINKEGYRPLDKVKDEIKESLKNDKKAELIMADVKGIANIENALKVKNVISDTVNHISFANPSFVRATNASEPVVSATATKAANGAFAGPVKGNNGVYMMKVINKSKTAEKYDAKSEEANLSNTALRMAMNGVIYDLYQNADVKDLRYKFF
ncbi:MAG: SurA N-terminal domain-containing protein [Bacteroides sp.]|nr:SurA N-terminal domain-containing protein [Roseburia sp.]MCM1346789.1 SurA N-terminal domain-containing protein [Bacteroides sp.]MCM1421021.1 SurA N-terminal domain-containing protein [Bacteroides sp.]